MKLRTLLLPVCLLLMSSLCWGWPACSGNWNQVPNGTSSANGVIYSADGITWQCQKPTPPNPTPNPSNSNTNTNTNSNSNSNSNTNTNNIKVSNNLSQKQNQNQSQNQSQNQTATGGNASASTASTASATGNGDGSNNTSSTTNISEKIPVATAYAPTALPTAPCFKGFGAGVQTMAVGGSFGGGKVDKNCAILETARSFGIAGAWVAYCKVMLTDEYVKKSGTTLQDCLQRYVPPAPVIVRNVLPAPAALPLPTPVTVTVNLPAPPEYRQTMTVVAPKKVVRHLPPNCQNVIQTVCKDTKK